MPEDDIDIMAWVVSCINGVGGFNANRAREGGGQSRIDVGAWIIRCLANPRCEGSAEVLAAIQEQRDKKAKDDPRRTT